MRTMGDTSDLHFDTLALHAGYDYGQNGGIFPPIHMGVAYPFDSGLQARAICAGELPGYTYARTINPTNDVLERRLAALEGAESCLATASGLAAIFLAALGLMAQPGDAFVTSNRLYGNTRNQFQVTLALMGFEPIYVDHPADPEAWDALISPRTRFLFVETPSNPDLFVADLVSLADLADARGLSLVVDSTLSSPAILRPLSLGADIVVHSTTKYLAGHSAALGGAIVGAADFIEPLRAGHHHYVGPTMSAFNAWLTLLGMETLPVRMPRMIGSAQRVAEFLAEHSRVRAVNYPGLASHPQHTVALDQMGGGGTSLLSFEVSGGMEGAWRVLDRLRVPAHATQLGGNQTVAVHPATTTHGSLAEKVRLSAGISDGLIRYSVGLEDPDDLISDLAQALA
jgi:O-acetylhomoserine/O-acetylserine sulfhydrylase-like pyridoxal-dependent enzyme